jgi:pyrimidine operon attenuation protein/uracil phosphoribosyltransferase
MTQEKQILLEAEELGRTLTRMAHEVVEKATLPDQLVLIGIRSRGVHLARRIARRIEAWTKAAPPVGIIDISQYRDDRAHDSNAVAGIPFEVAIPVDEKTVVLVDDVIFRGRTIRAAMDAVARFGQARRILVAVLVDRGARELPIRADIVGKNVEVGEGQRVNVMLQETDGIDRVAVVHWQVKSSLREI